MNIIGNRLSKSQQMRVIALANCLLYEGWEYQYCTFSAVDDMKVMIELIKGMGIDENYYSVFDDNLIQFINGSKIYFNQWEYHEK